MESSNEQRRKGYQKGYSTGRKAGKKKELVKCGTCNGTGTVRDDLGFTRKCPATGCKGGWIRV
jgi:DnaJ-class molecular chaperone